MLAQSIMARDHSAIRTRATTGDVIKFSPSHYAGFCTKGKEGGACGTAVKGDLITQRQIRADPSKDCNCGVEVKLERYIQSSRSSTDAMRGVTRYTDRLQRSAADTPHGRQS